MSWAAAVTLLCGCRHTRARDPAPGARRAEAGIAATVGASPRIERLDPRLDRLLPPGVVVERVASGLAWVEGPLWDSRRGELLFSDIPRNAVMAWRPGAGVELRLQPSGYTGSAPFLGPEPGSNGLVFDRTGALVLCQHGDRRIARLRPGGGFETLADRYRGRRLNSPNDAVLSANGDLYFTDPPFGLGGTFDDPTRELAWSGVYRLRASELSSRGGDAAPIEPELLTTELEAPNGIALSPEGDLLYVSNADARRAVWMAFPLDRRGGLGPGRVLYDATAAATERSGNPDGLEIDGEGNLWAAGPWGLWVLSPAGELLGRVLLGGPTGNCAWGEDGRTLFITAGSSVYRVRTAAVARPVVGPARNQAHPAASKAQERSTGR